MSEIHALVSSSKALLTWTARDAIQEAREACGGHVSKIETAIQCHIEYKINQSHCLRIFQGYLRAANLGELRNNHDPCCTYEGDNNVLGQQASNWLIRQWNDGVENSAGTAQFIERRDVILKYTFDAIRQKHSLNSIECKQCSVYYLFMCIRLI